MTIWIFDNDGVFNAYKTKEKALANFENCLDLMGSSFTEKKKAINFIKEKGFWCDYEIFSAELHD